MNRSPLVYVLVLNWNGRQMTVECVRSVLKSRYNRFEVVVIDNGSTDDSVSALTREFGNRIKIVRNKANLGYANGFNVGLSYGFVERKADYCLVMNNDTVIDESAIHELVKVAEGYSMAGFVTGKVYYYDRPNVFQTVGMREDPVRWRGDHIGNKEIDVGQYDTVCERCFADDVFTLIRRKLYFSTGGYNGLFFLQSEETDWQARAKKFGYKIMYTPDAKLWHKESMTLGKDSTLKAYYDARNPLLVILLHRSASFFRRYIRLHLKRDVVLSSLIYLKQFRITPAFAKWRGFFSALNWGFKSKKLTIKHFI